MASKAEVMAAQAQQQMIKEQQDKCPHPHMDQVLTRIGWRCGRCGKLVTKISYNELDEVLSKSKNKKKKDDNGK
jgi:ribosomal protein L37AE/L43A